VDRDAHQPFQFQLDRGDIEQAGAFGGVDRQVEVTLVVPSPRATDPNTRGLRA
jgi:hypothetical protein